MTRILLLVLAALIALPACAPRVQTGSSHRMVDDDDEQEANREALETLYERGADARAQEEVELSDGDSSRAGADLPVLPVVIVEPPPSDAERGEGRIDRDDLRSFVEGGPHQIFRAFLLEPVLNEDRFQGYRVASVTPGERGLSESGLRVGDVVTAINGTDISRPESFMRVWETITDADELRVEIVRRGNAQTLSWAIE